MRYEHGHLRLDLDPRLSREEAAPPAPSPTYFYDLLDALKSEGVVAHHWPLDDVGTSFRDTVDALPLADINGASDDRWGKLLYGGSAYSLRFDVAAGGGIATAAPATELDYMHQTGEFSFAGWVKFDAPAGGNRSDTLWAANWGSGTAGTPGPYVRRGNYDVFGADIARLVMVHGDRGLTSLASRPGKMPVGLHYVAMIGTATHCALYIDGEPMTGGPWAYPPDPADGSITQPLCLGCVPLTSDRRSLDGRLQDVEPLTRPLSPDEIRDHYEAGTQTTRADLAPHEHMDLPGLVYLSDPARPQGQDDGEQQYYLADWSGRGQHIYQASTTRRPVYRDTGLVPHPHLAHDGIDDCLDGPLSQSYPMYPLTIYLALDTTAQGPCWSIYEVGDTYPRLEVQYTTGPGWQAKIRVGAGSWGLQIDHLGGYSACIAIRITDGLIEGWGGSADTPNSLAFTGGATPETFSRTSQGARWQGSAHQSVITGQIAICTEAHDDTTITTTLAEMEARWL